MVGSVNWVGDRHRQFSVVLNILKTEQFCPVSSAVWTHLWTSVDPDSKYDVTIGNHYVANWKLGQDKTRFSSNRISRLDETVSKFSVADSLDLSPIQFTPQTPTRQVKTVLSCWCRWCELGIRHSALFSNMLLHAKQPVTDTKQQRQNQIHEWTFLLRMLLFALNLHYASSIFSNNPEWHYYLPW